jgi:hypothetical protein
MKKLVMLAFALVLSLAFIGCGTAPIYNVNNNAVVVPADKKASLEDVEKAILRAGGGLGWIMKKEAPGEIKGTLILRTHTAIVSIKYSTADYSINYVSSDNLNYDESTHTIHTNYNGWIQNLNKAIQVQLGLI